MESYLLNDKNLKMIKDLIVKKVFAETGETLDQKDPFFKNNVNMIVMAILEEEIDNFKKFPIEQAILKLNTIFILECVNFFLQATQNQEQQSSKIEDLHDEIFYNEPTQIEQPVVTQIQEEVKKEVFKKETLFFEQNGTDEYLLNFEKIKKVKIDMFAVDFCDYIITEKNNSFYVDNELVKIPIGNYTPETIPTQYFTYNPIDEKFVTEVKVDFDLKNSIGPTLGFKKKTYKEKLSEYKNNLCHKKYINLKIYFDEKFVEYKIPTNTKYNSCIFFESEKEVELSSLKKIKVELDYNTRGRKYFFKLQIN